MVHAQKIQKCGDTMGMPELAWKSKNVVLNIACEVRVSVRVHAYGKLRAVILTAINAPGKNTVPSKLRDI